MNKRVLLYILVIIVFFSSCGSYKKIARLEPVNVAKFSDEIFNGNYNNNSDTKYNNLWELLCRASSAKCRTKSSDSAIVDLRFINNRLNARLIESGKITQEIVLKAKVKDNYLSVKRKYFLIPIPFLLYYYNYKIILANSVWLLPTYS